MTAQSTPQTLGKAIRARRVQLGLTQAALADLIGGGMRQSEVSRLERDGVTLPRRARLEAIAAALDLQVGELLARSGWSGADVILGRAERGTAPAARMPEAEPSPMLRLRRDADPAEAGEPIDPAVERLRQARMRAADLIASFHLMEERSARVMDAFRGVHRTHGDESSPGRPGTGHQSG